jgi:hypothetical protein
MLNALRRILSGALTPPPVRSIPTDEQLADALKLVRVQSYTRKPPTNPKREAVLADLRALRAARSVPTEQVIQSRSRVAP